ncbi:serine protease 1 [Halyomorpha halys]|uniref:serine protease 1 n=1 Tax=Halyomorpha halys TaxID=286706 RepID=UPI0006D4D53F|nr:serine protease snake-like [Halyomorpha halys]
MKVVYISILSVAGLLFVLALILILTGGGGTAEPRLKLNETCKSENFTGICASKDSCLTNLTTTKLESCNEGDLSLFCCPKRIPGEKAKEMCEIYGKAAIKHVMNPEKPDCRVEEEVRNGHAKEKEFPHMVLIAKLILPTSSSESSGLLWMCSGSVVSPQFVLSVAHCKVTKDDGYVFFGINKKPTSDEIMELFRSHSSVISDVYIHPHYNTKNNANDIALYKLPIKLNESQRPICLDTGISLFNKMVIETSFGINKEKQFNLEKVGLNIIDPGSCAATYKRFIDDFPERYICAGENTCWGDSGGPIQIAHSEHKCMYTLIGVSSFGPNCSLDTNLPSVYTKVSDYIGWIEDIVWPA